MMEQITVCRPDLGLHIKCEHAVMCRRCNGQGEVAGNAARTVPPVGCPSCGGTGFRRFAALRAALTETEATDAVID